MKALAVAAIRFYQRRLRHLHNRACIYQPTCSEYTRMAIEKHGVVRGIRYGWARIRRCNGALFAGGVDYP